MTNAIDLTTEQRKTLNDLLRQFLPGVAVWAYGSRVKWTARPNSDLDLVAFATPAQRPQVSELKDALSESNLPFPVDLHVWDDVPERFHEIIRKEYVVVQEAGQNSQQPDMRGGRTETRTGGRPATAGVIPGDFALSVGKPDKLAPPGWRWTALSDVARLETGHTPSRRHPEYWGGDVPWIGIKDATENHGRALTDTFQHTNELGIANSSARILPANTVCLSRTASVGYVVVMGRPMATSQDFVNWVCSDALDHRFLKYVLLAEHSAFLRFASGTTHQTIYFPEVKAFHVCLPPLSEQLAIAQILGTLDDKIELNWKMNETLEAMARALFKSWFVDFDPVRAKAEGRDTGLPKSLADLFPDSFEDSELGEIPKGWKVKTLGDLLELAYGKALKAEDRHDGNVPVFGSNGQVGWHDEQLVTGPGIIVGRKGNPGITTWVPGDFFAIDTTFYVVPKANCHSLHFLFHVLQFHDLASLGADSAVPGLNRNMAYMSTQVLPPETLLAKFDSHASVLARRAYQCTEESRTLADLRDTLLPNLISGKLRVEGHARFFGGDN